MEPTQAQTPTTTGAPEFVLIVEDDEAVALLIYEVLVRIWSLEETVYGFASTLRQARCIFEKGNIPDILIADLYLPDSTGVETIDRLHKHLPATCGILAMSAYYSHIEGSEALAHGATRFLSKQEHFDKVTILEMAARTWATTKGLRVRLQAEREVVGMC